MSVKERIAAMIEPQKASVEDVLAQTMAMLELERSRADVATLRADSEAKARIQAESLLDAERVARAEDAGALRESRIRVAELESRPIPEPQIIVREVSIPGRDNELREMIHGLPAKITIPASAPRPTKLSFDVHRDRMGSIQRIVARPEA